MKFVFVTEEKIKETSRVVVKPLELLKEDSESFGEPMPKYWALTPEGYEAALASLNYKWEKSEGIRFKKINKKL